MTKLTKYINPLVARYFKEIETFKYDNSFLELKTKTSKNNYLEIDSILKQYPINHEKPSTVKIASEKFPQIIRETINEIFDCKLEKNFDEYYRKIRFIKAEKPFVGIVKLVTNYQNEVFHDFTIIGNYGTSISAVIVAHEFIHVKMLPKIRESLNDYFGNYHYYELPSMITEKIMAHKLNQITNDNINKIFNEYRFNRNAEGASLANINRRNENVKLKLWYLFQLKNQCLISDNYTYTISDIYASYLFDLFLEDERAFLKKYRELIAFDINIPDFLKYYGTNLVNNQVKDQYIKKLTQNSIKI